MVLNWRGVDLAPIPLLSYFQSKTGCPYFSLSSSEPNNAPCTSVALPFKEVEELSQLWLTASFKLPTNLGYHLRLPSWSHSGIHVISSFSLAWSCNLSNFAFADFLLEGRIQLWKKAWHSRKQSGTEDPGRWQQWLIRSHYRQMPQSGLIFQQLEVLCPPIVSLICSSKIIRK